MGFLAGLTGTMTLTFFLGVAPGLPFTRVVFVGVQVLLLFLLLALVRWRTGPAWFHPARPALPSAPRMPRWAVALLILLGIWSAAKIGTGAFLLLNFPPYFDDTVKNWNFRGKIFFVMKAPTTTAPGRSEDLLGQLHSYPPAVSMSKTWLATLAGEWHEGLVNSIHLAWFACTLLLLFAFLRRWTTLPWALGGTYLLVSLPLVLIQGTQAYAEIFLAAHFFAVAALLAHAAAATERVERIAFLRLAAVMAAFLPLTKNEGLVLYLPFLFLVATAMVAWFRRRDRLLIRDARLATLWFLGATAATTLPWLIYKWSLGLSFGNAHAISDTVLSWRPGVLKAIAIGLFFEGNWLLLFPLLAVLLAMGWKTAFRSPLMILTALFLLLFAVQLPIFLLTDLSTEATFQTGYSRGIVHLAPLAVAVGTVILHRLVGQNAED